jgi:hypothetical protein
LHVTTRHAPSIELSALLLGKNRNAAAKALVDSGATGNLISRKFAAKQRMIPKVLDRPIPLKNADDSESLIKSYVTIPMVLEDHKGRKHQETISMYIANIGQQDIILGTGWLIKHNPEINWETYNLSFTRCPATCKVERDFMVKSIHDNKKRTTRARRTLLPEKLWAEDNDHPEQYVNQWTHMGLKAARAFFPETDSLYARLSPLAQDVDPKYLNISQQLAQKAARDAIKKKVEDIVPDHYHEYLSIFDSKKLE